MKKVIVFTMLVGLVATVANADYFLDWRNNSALLQTGGAGISAGAGSSALVQLVWPGPDGMIDADVFPGGVGGVDDVVLAEGIHTSDGGVLGDNAAGWSFQYQSTEYRGDSLFMRAFVGAAADAGVQYAVSPMVPGIPSLDPGGTPPPTRTQVVWGGVGFLDIGDNYVIPEPTTIALLGLGALTALWRRRRG
jgi:hypothetical protein